MEQVKKSQDLIRAFEKGKSSDLQFSEITMKLHYESKEKKVGHKPVSIGTIPIPTDLKIAYVEAWNNGEHYYYVVNQLTNRKENSPLSKVVPDRNAAVSLIFEKLKEFALK